MTLLPANFAAPNRGADAASGNEPDSDARANVRVPMAASSTEGMQAGGRNTGGDLNRVSVGSDGRLYWDGKPVVVRRRLQLSAWQTFGAILVGIAALVIAASGGINAAITAHDWMCSAKWVTSYCTAPPLPPVAPAPRPELPN